MKIILQANQAWFYKSGMQHYSSSASEPISANPFPAASPAADGCGGVRQAAVTAAA